MKPNPILIPVACIDLLHRPKLRSADPLRCTRRRIQIYRSLEYEFRKSAIRRPAC